MSTSPLRIVEAQAGRARRRLFLQQLIERLSLWWAAGLVLGACWLIAEPHLGLPGAQLRWEVFGGILGVATLLAAGLAWRRRPSLTEAALDVDERFHLRERLTTCLALTEAERASPAGAALLADTTPRVAGLRVPERFPLQLPWSASLVPLGVLLVAAVVFFYQPTPGQAGGKESDPLAEDPAVLAEIDRKKQQLKPEAPRAPLPRPRSPELERFREASDQLAKRPTDTREQAREAVKEMTTLEEEMKKRAQELAQRVDAFREQMKQAERLSKKDPADRLQKKKKGPAERLDQALEQGDLARARQEAERLSRKLDPEEQADRLRKKKEEADRLQKKLEEPDLQKEERERLQRELEEARREEEQLEEDQLDEEKKKQLEEQLAAMEDQLKQLARKDEQEKKLREMAEKGQIDPEQLARELDQLQKNGERLGEEGQKEAEKLAEKLGECKKCLQEGKDGEAAEKLRQAADQLGKMDPSGEQAELARQAEMVTQARQAICRALDGGQAAGQRPQGKAGETGAKETRSPSQVDEKGQIDIVDFVPGEGFKGPFKPGERAADIRRAAQQASEALDRQRLPRSAVGITRGYFERLREMDRK